MSRLSKKALAQLKNGFFLAIIGGLFLASGILVWAATLKLPTFEEFAERQVQQSTKIYDRTGTTILYNVHNDIKRKVVPLSEISNYIQKATIAVEDANFYNHNGIEPKAILRAILVDISTGSLAQGGSTITQQVVKNVLLTQEKALKRKAKELFLALQLERELTKDHILELYLNESSYSGVIYGVEEAAQTYFGKKAADVTLAEAAFLAAIPQSPTRYSPYGNYFGDLEKRKNLVLSRMLDENYITEDEFVAAKNEKVTFLPLSDSGIKAPHFSMMIREYLEEKYGKELVDSGGLKVISTLDWTMQKKAEEIVREVGKENAVKFNANNAAMVGIDPKTGQILILVGSRDYFDTDNDGNFNVALAKRQPGSSFKPIVYATAFGQGYTPETVLFDVQTQFSTNCDGEGTPLPGYTKADCYMPVNYDGGFRGPLSLRYALAESRNVPAIKTLYLVGIKKALSTAHALGITSLTDPNRYGLTLVLGGGEVTPLEMTSAYSVFANDGIRNPTAMILRVEDSKGTILEEYKPEPVQALDTQVARQINDVLSDDAAREHEYGRNSLLTVPGYQVAAKTGTTNDYRDAWIIGYTPTLALGAWAGNNDNSPMEKKIAGFIIAPMWNKVMREVLPTLSHESFTAPEEEPNNLKPVLRGIWQNGGETYVVDKTTGKLATEFTPEDQREERYVPNVHEILHWVEKGNPRGAVPSNPQSDPQYQLWEKGVQKWAVEKAGTLPNFGAKPTDYDNVHTPTSLPIISITSPVNGTIHKATDRITVSFKPQETSLSKAITSAQFYFNGIYIGGSDSTPFSFSFIPKDTGFTQNSNTIRVVAHDTVGNKGEASTTFTLTE